MAAKTWLAMLAAGLVLGVSASAVWMGVPSEEIAPTGTTPAEGPTNVTQVAKFTIEIRGGGTTPTGAWWSVSGGDQNIEIVTYTTGEDVHEQRRPGQTYYTDISLKGPFTPGRKALKDWILAAAKGKRERVDVTLSFVDDEGYDLVRIGVNVSATGSSVTPHAPGLRTEAPVDLALFEYDELCPVYLEIQVAGTVVHASPPSEGAPVLAARPAADPPADFPRGRTIVDVNARAATLARAPGDPSWLDWFQSHAAKGDDVRAPVLRYLDSGGDEVLNVTAFDCWPVRHDVINVDSRSGSSEVREILECVVERFTFP